MINQDQKIDKQIINKNIGTYIIGLSMYHKIEDLIKENIMLQNLTDLDNVPLHKYIEFAKPKNSLIRLDLDNIIQNAEDMIQDLKTKYGIPDIARKCYYEKLCDIFNLYFFSIKSKKYIDNGKYDENYIPEYYPETIRQFITAAYPVFETVQNIKASYDFTDLLSAEYEAACRKTYLNRIKILSLILIGRIRSGRNITRLLFKDISAETEISKLFKRLCRIKNGKYIVCNTDRYSPDFQLAVFDLFEFADIDNKALFNAKVNQYLNLSQGYKTPHKNAT